MMPQLSVIMALVVGVFMFVFSIKRPEVGISVMLILIASIIFESALPLVPIPGGSLHITDVLLLFFLLLIPLKLLTDERFRFQKTPADLPLMLFYSVALVSASLLIFRGHDFNMVMRSLRGFTYYLVFFVITNFIREKKQIRFLVGAMFGIATLVALAMVVQAIVGESVRLLPGRIEPAGTFGQAVGATRILPPGDIVVFVMFIMAISLMSFVHKPLFASGVFYLAFLLGIGNLLTFNRNYWASIIIVLFIFAVLISGKEKRRFVAIAAAAAIIFIIVMPPLINSGGRPAAYYDSIRLRFSSLFTPTDTYKSESLEWRKLENRYAWRSFVRHPILGIGLGQNYRPRIYPMDYDSRGRKRELMSYIHNGYLDLLVDMGLIGFLPFLWFLLRVLTRGFSAWKKLDDPQDKGLVLGFTLSGMAIMLSAMLTPRFSDWAGILVIAVTMGLIEAIIQIERMPLPAPVDRNKL